MASPNRVSIVLPTPRPLLYPLLSRNQRLQQYRARRGRRNGEGALAEFMGGVLAAGDGVARVVGGGFFMPLHPFGRIEPAVAEFNQPPCGMSDGGGTRVVRIVGGRDIGREPAREREVLEGGGCGPIDGTGAVQSRRPAQVALMAGT